MLSRFAVVSKKLPKERGVVGQCRQNTYLDVAAPRNYTGVAVIVTGALRVGSPVSVVWRRWAVCAVGGGAWCAAVRGVQGKGSNIASCWISDFLEDFKVSDMTGD
jgi:hypothetical protein